MRKGENKNYSFAPFPPVAEQKMQKKKVKKLKKLKNTTMASIQAKIFWKRPRKRENKNYRFVPFLPDALQKFQKNSKKIQKYHYGIISSQNSLEKAKKERK